MSIGTGIAIAGVWVMVAVAIGSKQVSSTGFYIAAIIASLVTWWLK